MPYKSLLIALISVITACQSAVPANLLETYAGVNGFLSFKMGKLPTGHDTVRVTLNGRQGVFIVDTGAQLTVIHSALLNRYNIPQSDLLNSEQSYGAGGVITLDYYRVNGILLEEQPFDLQQIAAIDLSTVFAALGASSGIQLDGIIGQDILIGYNGLVDIAGQQLLLQPDIKHTDNAEAQASSLAAYLHTQDYQKIPLMKLDSGLETIDTSINGQSGLFIIDSGAGRSILHSAKTTKFHVKKADHTGAGSSAGAGGAFSYQRFAIQSLVLGSVQLSKTYIDVADLSAVVNAAQQLNNADIDGVIGQDVLIQNAGIIDVAGQQLFLKVTDS